MALSLVAAPIQRGARLDGVIEIKGNTFIGNRVRIKAGKTTVFNEMTAKGKLPKVLSYEQKKILKNLSDDFFKVTMDSDDTGDVNLTGRVKHYRTCHSERLT